MNLKKDAKNRAKLVTLVDKYTNRIVNSTSWTIDKTKSQMIVAIKKIMGKEEKKAFKAGCTWARLVGKEK